ncbi:FAD/NAD(P)-binding protein [Streptomyces sp. NPDC060020]|uniref:FAD/NAD(P)-binding protein n=1 Tax=Streptomyces sp. NPDC060020 TaxID=3347038 RepID=UPI0036B04FD7
MTAAQAAASEQPAPPFKLALVGGGPRATYLLERLSATIGRLDAGRRLEVHVFERSGAFGAGQAHDPAQARTSYLNRIACQVGFAADESVVGAGPLRQAAERPTLYEWCRRQFARTGEPDFAIGPGDWPKRYVHGLALRDMFDTFAEELRAHPAVEVQLHTAEVVDVRPSDDCLRVITGEGAAVHPADAVVLLTGHTSHDPRRVPASRRLAEFAERTGAQYVPQPYPLDVALDVEHCGPGTVVGCAGMGLTAIDAILYLTEGRGGTFHHDPVDGLVYRPSGNEPASIVAFSGAGLFTFARPDNHKERDGGPGDHTGRFFTTDAIDRLRANVGRPVAHRSGKQLQLDFDQDVLPLAVLEMAHLHYAALFGPASDSFLTRGAAVCAEAFVTGPREANEDPEQLLGPVDEAVGEVGALLAEVLQGTVPVPAAQARAGWPVREVLLHWVETVYGPSVACEVAHRLDRGLPPGPALEGSDSPWGLETSPEGNRFSWWRTVSPVEPQGTAADQRSAVLRFMEHDGLWAQHGNVRNPHKAAADGVWRDLRSVISYAVDDAGLVPRSQRRFLDRYVRHHNRLANGAAAEIMDKVTALIRHGIVDVSTGPGAGIRLDEEHGRLMVEGPRTGTSRELDVLVEARIHPFDPRLDALPLYRSLLERGVVRLWINKSEDGDTFVPGGLDLTPQGHPVRADGSVDPRVTVLGVPSEGARSFLLSALRPNADHYVMHDIMAWLEGFWETVAPGSAMERPSPQPQFDDARPRAEAAR